MKSQSLLSLSAWLLAVLAVPLTIAAQDTQQRTLPAAHYTVTDLGTLSGGNFSQPFFINRYGLVSGSSSLADGNSARNPLAGRTEGRHRRARTRGTEQHRVWRQRKIPVRR